MTGPATDSIRRFNRFYTRRIGLLEEGLVGSRFSLTEARLLHELATGGPRTAAEIRAALGLDAGYLSRLLRRFESAGLVARTPVPGDARKALVRLTAAGEDAFAPLDHASSAATRALLEPLDGPARAALLAALGTVEALLSGPPGEVVLRGPEPGDLGWIVERHGALYAAEFGFGQGFEGIVARIVADFASLPAGAPARVWIAARDGRRLGTVMLVPDAAEGTGRLRLLLVEPAARGLGLGRRLAQACIAEARALGFRRLVLWTKSDLLAARAIYAAEGFRCTASRPAPEGGADEDWTLDLAAALPPAGAAG